MTTMLDKVSAAIEAKIRPAQPIYDWDSKDIARAALEAIREPSEGVADRGADEIGYAEAVSCRYAAETAWTAMIDAILSETHSP